LIQEEHIVSLERAGLSTENVDAMGRVRSEQGTRIIDWNNAKRELVLLGIYNPLKEYLAHGSDITNFAAAQYAAAHIATQFNQRAGGAFPTEGNTPIEDIRVKDKSTGETIKFASADEFASYAQANPAVRNTAQFEIRLVKSEGSAVRKVKDDLQEIHQGVKDATVDEVATKLFDSFDYKKLPVTTAYAAFPTLMEMEEVKDDGAKTNVTEAFVDKVAANFGLDTIARDLVLANVKSTVNRNLGSSKATSAEATPPHFGQTTSREESRAEGEGADVGGAPVRQSSPALAGVGSPPVRNQAKDYLEEARLIGGIAASAGMMPGAGSPSGNSSLPDVREHSAASVARNS